MILQGHPQCRRKTTRVGRPSGRCSCADEGALEPTAGTAATSLASGDFQESISFQNPVLLEAGCDILIPFSDPLGIVACRSASVELWAMGRGQWDGGNGDLLEVW